jgi:hypothetical protein
MHYLIVLQQYDWWLRCRIQRMALNQVLVIIPDICYQRGPFTFVRETHITEHDLKNNTVCPGLGSPTVIAGVSLATVAA